MAECCPPDVNYEGECRRQCPFGWKRVKSLTVNYTNCAETTSMTYSTLETSDIESNVTTFTPATSLNTSNDGVYGQDICERIDLYLIILCAVIGVVIVIILILIICCTRHKQRRKKRCMKPKTLPSMEDINRIENSRGLEGYINSSYGRQMPNGRTPTPCDVSLDITPATPKVPHYVNNPNGVGNTRKCHHLPKEDFKRDESTDGNQCDSCIVDEESAGDSEEYDYAEEDISPPERFQKELIKGNKRVKKREARGEKSVDRPLDRLPPEPIDDLSYSPVYFERNKLRGLSVTDQITDPSKIDSRGYPSPDLRVNKSDSIDFKEGHYKVPTSSEIVPEEYACVGQYLTIPDVHLNVNDHPIDSPDGSFPSDSEGYYNLSGANSLRDVRMKRGEHSPDDGEYVSHHPADAAVLRENAEMVSLTDDVPNASRGLYIDMTSSRRAGINHIGETDVSDYESFYQNV